jgi:hypothetical protein
VFIKAAATAAGLPAHRFSTHSLRIAKTFSSRRVSKGINDDSVNIVFYTN